MNIELENLDYAFNANQKIINDIEIKLIYLWNGAMV
jgi:hypothetical protein